MHRGHNAAPTTSVDDIDDVIVRVRAHGAELLGGVAQYEDVYRLCYLRGPGGIIVALAEQAPLSERLVLRATAAFAVVACER